jgi:hypothetical protein
MDADFKYLHQLQLCSRHLKHLLVPCHDAWFSVSLQWGVAYRLAGTEEQQQQTIAYLEWREKQYDVRRLCHVYTADSQEQPVLQDVLVYIATESPANVNWLGPAPLPAIAQQIATSRCACFFGLECSCDLWQLGVCAVCIANMGLPGVVCNGLSCKREMAGASATASYCSANSNKQVRVFIAWSGLELLSILGLGMHAMWMKCV